jgi:hypothetical protein
MATITAEVTVITTNHLTMEADQTPEVSDMCVHHTVTCIARQRTGKHLTTEYTHATIELQMLLPVARQQSEHQ